MKRVYRVVGMMVVLGVFIGGLALVGYSAEQRTVIRWQDWHMTEWINFSLEQTKEMYMKMHPDVLIKSEPVAIKDRVIKFTVASEAKNAPDVIHIDGPMVYPYCNEGYLLDLGSLIGQEEGDFLGGFYESHIELCRYKGRTYALPDTVQAVVPMYNMKLFREAGLDPDKFPTDYDEFLESLKKLTKDTNGDGRIDQWGISVVGDKTSSFFMRFCNVFWSFGGDFMNEDMTASYLNNPDSIAGFKYYIELYTKHGVIPPGIAQTHAQDMRVMFAEEKVAIMGGEHASTIVDLREDLTREDVARLFGITSWPVKKTHVTFVYPHLWAISAYTKVPKEAWDFLKFLTSTEIMLKRFEDVGYPPANVEAAESLIIKEDKFASAHVKEAPYSRTTPYHAGWLEIADAVAIAAQEAYVGMKTPEQALCEAHKAVEEITERYRTE